jgi:methylmalonyl-CoA mutase
VIPLQDYPALYEAGAKAIFGPGTSISDAAIDLLGKLGCDTKGQSQQANRRASVTRPIDAH